MKKYEKLAIQLDHKMIDLSYINDFPVTVYIVYISCGTWYPSFYWVFLPLDLGFAFGVYLGVEYLYTPRERPTICSERL